MNKLLFLILALLSLSLQAVSQVTPTWAWGAYYYNGNVVSTTYHDDYIYVIGNYYNSSIQIGSVMLPNAGGFDSYIAKWDTLGNLIWAKSISDTGSQSVVAILVNSNNEIVVAGNNTNPNLVIGNDTISAVLYNTGFIAKYDLNGNVLNAFSIIGVFDMCIDNSDTIYAATLSGLSKYSNSGILIWQKPIPVMNIRYSPVGNCLMGTGSFNLTLTLGGFSITANYSILYGYYSDVFCIKTDLNGDVNWLINISNTARWDIYKSPYLRESTGELYVPLMFLGMGGQNAYIIKISPSGAASYLPLSNSLSGVAVPSLNANDHPAIMHISGKDSNISYMLQSDAGGEALCIFNLNTQQTTLSLIHCQSDYHFFNGLNSIYMQGLIGSVAKTFGKLGPNLLTSPQTSLGHHYCASTTIGTTMHLNSNVIGGVPPLTYSWAPSSGLSSTSSDSTSFVVNSTVSYTLTVTDAISQEVKDTFAIILDTVLSPLLITPQYPTFCHDSMYLNTNLGIDVQWYKYNGSYWVFNSPLPISQNTIFSPGLYRARGWNACGSVEDTMEIHPTVHQPTIIKNNDTLACTNASNVSYQWYLNGTAIGISDSLLTITQYGQYIVKITDSAGCIGFDTMMVIGLGIQGITFDNSISIYPNPTSGLMNIEYSLNEASPLELKLFDAEGRIIWKKMIEEKALGKFKLQIDLNTLSIKPGVYLLSGRTSSNHWTNRIVYIEK